MSLLTLIAKIRRKPKPKVELKVIDCAAGKHDCTITKRMTPFGVAIWRECKHCFYRTEH